MGVILAALAAGGVAQNRLNVIIVLVDDLGWADLGCQGSTYYETPRIDRLASEGMRFTDAYAACAVCSPTRAAVMTGRYPARLGVTDWIRARFQRGKIGTPAENPTRYVGGANRKLLCPPNAYWMEKDETTIAELLGEAGYVSAHIGKWHLGDDAWYPTAQGFSENHGGCDYGQPPSYFDPYRNKRLTGIPHLAPRKKGEFLTDREGDEAAAFIKRNKDRPFFLHLAHYAVHTPIQAKAEVTAKYEAKPKTQQKNARYAALVESVDDAVGKVTAALREAGVEDRTLIIFTSDNGGLRGPTHNAPLRSGKGFPHEGGIRVPLIVKWPGVVGAGTTSDEPVCSIDYLPTIAEAAGIDPEAGREIDGRSLVAHLKSGGKSSLGRDALYWHFPHYRGGLAPYGIVRAGNWKLIKRYEGPTYELYDLAADLSEKTDLAEKRPDLVKELDAKLMAHLREVGAKHPRKNPGYRPPQAKPQAKPGAPRVLLIGDSISIGYTPHVQRMLAPEVAVFRPLNGRGGAENCQGTNHGVARIDSWLAAHGGKWDVIHFNFGLHDLKRVHPETRNNSGDGGHPHQADPETYGRQLDAIVERLKKTGARLIYGTTTPVPPGAVRPYRAVGDSVRYNTVAKAIMKRHGVEVNDLYQFAFARLGKIQRKANVHFTPNGSRVLGRRVANRIRAALKARATQEKGDQDQTRDWPQFRGAGGDGVVEQASAPTRWGPDKNVKWRIPLAMPANGSPIVVGHRVFLCMAEDDEGKRRSLYCFDRRDGRRLWVRTVVVDRAMPTHRTNPYCGSTPASDGTRVVVWHSTGGLHCYALDGTEQWSRSFGVFEHSWGYGTSPVFHDGKIILNSGPGGKSFVAAFDPETGRTLWRTDEPDHLDAAARAKKRLAGSWCTPIVTRHGDADQIICAQPTRIVAYNPDNGVPIWWCRGLTCDRGDLVYSSPVVIDGVCMVRGGYDGPSIGVRLGGRGDVTETHRLWRHAKRKSNVGSGVAVDGRLLIPDIDSFMACVDAKTGELLWRERFSRGQCWGSIIRTAGRLYVMNQKGETVVCEARSDALRIIGRNDLGEQTNATPVFAGGEVFIRTHKSLYCIADLP